MPNPQVTQKPSKNKQTNILEATNKGINTNTKNNSKEETKPKKVSDEQLIKEGYDAVIVKKFGENTPGDTSAMLRALSDGLGKYKQEKDENKNNPFITIRMLKQNNTFLTDRELSLRNNFKIYPDREEINEQPIAPQQSPFVNQEGLLETFDKRLIFNVVKEEDVVYAVTSLESRFENPLVDGMVFYEEYSEDGKTFKEPIDWTKYKKADSLVEFFGVPSIMNENAYINLQKAGGKFNNKYLFEGNKKRWYNITNTHHGKGEGVQMSSTPTTTEIIRWSQEPENFNKFPYKFQDFAFCKWWNKIPNNYLITLRRYPYPINDAVDLGKIEGMVENSKLRPAATMVTWLGEASGNSINSILGGLETSLRWGEAKADVWKVTSDVQPGQVNNPAPKAAFVLQALTGGLASTRTKQTPPVPPDPYENGPYANKIYGPVNVIDKVKKRERGMEFKHSLNLIFEYVARPIGGINTKAVMLDILGNVLVCCSATAPFWGGINRFMPSAAQGQTDPFLGGPAGRQAWLNANPQQFLGAVMQQFSKIYDNIKGIFDQILGNPIEGLKKLANDGAKDFMKYATTDGRTMIQGMRSLLTGEPVGEWHLTIGAPHNPMMMIGNLICTNCKIEFGDQLGPDDFPMELKVTVTLEHGMPRDSVGIQSMFNAGKGRFYALPKGYEESFSSLGETRVDKVSGKSVLERLKKMPVPVNSQRTALYALGFDAPKNEKKEEKENSQPEVSTKSEVKNVKQNSQKNKK